MKSISNKSICTWYYAFFVINAIVASLALVIMVLKLAIARKNVIDILSDSLSSFLVFAIGVVNALFFYLMCDRTLLEDQTKMKTKTL
jgi:hypothetical protein